MILNGYCAFYCINFEPLGAHHEEILGEFTLSLETLSDIHWLLLLRFAKASEVLSTLRSVGDAHWARVGASALGVCLAGIRPKGNVRCSSPKFIAV